MRRLDGNELVLWLIAVVYAGDVVYLDALGQPMIILGSHETAVELLEKRSANYSDRSISTMAKL